MCIPNRIKKYIAEKEALDAKIAQLEKLEAATAPVKNLLIELLGDYAKKAPEELPGIWEEILAIGQQHNLSVQPLAVDEQREWEATNAENDKLKKELEEAQAEIKRYDFAYAELEGERDDLESILTELRSQFNEYKRTIEGKPLPVLHNDDVEKYLNPTPEAEEEAQITGFLQINETFSSAPPETPDTIPALTLWQPWASLIAEKVKRIETRSWATSYRGPIAIHAAKKPVDISDYPHLFDLLPDDCEFPLGAVVVIANLVDCVEMTPEFIAQQSETELKCGDWQPGRFAWILEIIRPVVPPVSVSGGQKLWNWSGTSVNVELEYLEKFNTKPEPEYEPDEAYDTVESILEGNGFFQADADMPADWDTSELYENYRGWDIFYSFPNGGIVAIGLNNSESNQSNQFWDASTEYIQEIEGNTFPESLADYDEIVAWTKQLIDELIAVTPVESLEVPGQLSLDLDSSASAEELTSLQKLLPKNDYYHACFQPKEIGGRYQVFVNIHSSIEEGVEKAKIEVGWLQGNSEKRIHCIHAGTFVCQYNDNTYQQDIRKMALDYAKHFLREKEAEAKAETNERIARSNGDKIEQPGKILESEPVEPETETRFKAMGYSVQVFPQLPMGVTFRFLDAEGTVKFTNSLTAPEIGDHDWKTCACELIQNYQNKEAARLEKLTDPYAKEEDRFIELVKLTPAVGYIKRRDNGELISAYAAFANCDTAGKKTATFAKPRAKKWAEHLQGALGGCGWKVEEPRKIKRMVAESGAKQQFAYEIKITGEFSIGQLQKLAEEDFSLLPNEVAAPKPAVKLPVTALPTIYRVKVNGYELASGEKEEILRSRFEDELEILGGSQMSVLLVHGTEVIESYRVSDFEFTQVEDFDSDNPEYEVVHLRSHLKFKVWRRVVIPGLPESWQNDVTKELTSRTAKPTREAAAADAVRRLLKAEQAE